MTSRSLVTSYLKTGVVNLEKEERLFHLFQFLSFVKSLGVSLVKDCQKYRIKDQFYYGLRFPLSKFVEFTNIRISNQSARETLISYFKKLQTLDPIVKEFSDKSFRSYVCFPYVECNNTIGNFWIIELLIVEELLYFRYPFQLPKSFMTSRNKNDLRLKVLLIQSFSVTKQEKILNLEEFFNKINVRNNQLVQIKQNLIRLLKELFEDRIIQNEFEIVLKSGKKIYGSTINLNTTNITHRIKIIKITEILKFL